MKFLHVLFFKDSLAVSSATAISIDHDKVQPIQQPEAVTAEEKLGVKFKPRLTIDSGCVSFPAVNIAGETSGGLKGTNFDSGCTDAPLGSQVYGRAAKYEDAYAIMYAWYFPKGFWGELASRRHDWVSAVVWIDDPEAEKPRIAGLSTYRSDSEFEKQAPVPDFAVANDTTMKVYHSTWIFGGAAYLEHTGMVGDFQDLIMWDQLPEAARLALNDDANWGKSKVPISDANFQEELKNAWPL